MRYPQKMRFISPEFPKDLKSTSTAPAAWKPPLLVFCLEDLKFLLFLNLQDLLFLNLQEPDLRSSLQGSLPNSLPHPHTCTDAEDRTSALPNTVLTPLLKHVPHSFMTYLFKTQARSSSRSETLSQLSGFQNTGYDPLEGCEISSVVCNQQWFCFLESRTQNTRVHWTQQESASLVKFLFQLCVIYILYICIYYVCMYVYVHYICLRMYCSCY